MIKKLLLNILWVHIIIFMAFSNSYALEKTTHKVINEYIAENTIREFSLEQYLFDRLLRNANLSNFCVGK